MLSEQFFSDELTRVSKVGGFKITGFVMFQLSTLPSYTYICNYGCVVAYTVCIFESLCGP